MATKQLAIQRKTLTGVTETFEFEEFSPKFIVKNFTSGDIFVSFESDLDEEISIKIASNYAQVCMISDYLNSAGRIPEMYYSNKIYVKGTGEVEVQQLLWK